jgi:hypothetical protein
VTRLYANPGFWARNTLLVLFLVVVFFYGWWELWRASRGPSADASTGFMFGVVFIGGSLFALRQLYEDHRDLVATLDRDDKTGKLAAAVWQPLGAEKLVAEPGEFTDWRLHTKLAGRGSRTYFIYVDFPGRPRPLRFNLKPGVDVTGLRQLAPEALAEYANRDGTAAPSG